MTKGRNAPAPAEPLPLIAIVPWVEPANGDWTASTKLLATTAWKYFAAIADRGMRYGGPGLVVVMFNDVLEGGVLYGEAEWMLDDIPCDNYALTLHVRCGGKLVADAQISSEKPHSHYTQQLRTSGLNDRVGVITALDIDMPQIPKPLSN